MFGYRVPAPNEALLISGARPHKDSGLAFRIVVGHGAFVMPIVRKASLLTLAMREAEVNEQCVSQQGISLRVSAVIAFKVGSDDPSIAAAAQRFLANQDQMDELTGQIFAGPPALDRRQHDRRGTSSASGRRWPATCSTPPRSRWATSGSSSTRCRSRASTTSTAATSRHCPSPQRAAVNQAAKIAEAKAAQASAEAEQESARRQAEYARATAVQRAQYQSEIDSAQQMAAQSGPLAAAKAQQAVLEEQAKVALRNAELREAQLSPRS